MAVRGQQKQKGSSEGGKPQPIRVDSFEVVRVKEWDDGGLTADLKINGIEIWGVRYVCVKDKEFLSFPQRKGQDGNYYHICRAYLSEADQETIIKAIFDKSNEKK